MGRGAVVGRHEKRVVVAEGLGAGGPQHAGVQLCALIVVGPVHLRTYRSSTMSRMSAIVLAQENKPRIVPQTPRPTSTVVLEED